RAPPPPFISPLSLHDALPISSRPRARPRDSTRVLNSIAMVLGRHDWRHCSNPCYRGPLASGGTMMIDDEKRAAAFAAVEEVRPGDRKSTRLNSSHVSISYAVF